MPEIGCLRDHIPRVRVIYDEVHKLHRDPHGYHPERPERLELAVNCLRDYKAHGFVEFSSTCVPDVKTVLEVHDLEYVEWVKAESNKGFHYVDPDTYVNEHTFTVSLRYATSAYDIASKSAEVGGLWIMMPRPGGHHAGRRGPALGVRSLGFCIFNYAAVIAKTLLKSVGRVLIIDFDAHHGNGTQEIFWYEPNVVHIDVHEDGIYPGTGSVTDVGGSGCEGSKLNIPLPPGSGDPQYMWVLNSVVDPVLNTFKPRAVVISAGFDAFINDPLTHLKATEITYLSIGYYLHLLLKRGILHSVITNLEGGYGDGLSKGFKAYVDGLTGNKKPIPPQPIKPPKDVADTLEKVLQRYWGVDVKTNRLDSV